VAYLLISLLSYSDRYTHSLFQKINQNGTPLFGTYRNPPSNALDLGCGPGYWVLDAAAAWRAAGTKVVGLDLVDVFDEEWMSEKASMPNVEFVRGNL
jgi:ubiquinone/menaquinone biosynthesis C-methylase UbiE